MRHGRLSSVQGQATRRRRRTAFIQHSLVINGRLSTSQ